jgi:hypothetical protein
MIRNISPPITTNPSTVPMPYDKTLMISPMRRRQTLG